MRTGILLFALAFMATLLAASPARADRIDGNWCNGARHMTIDGPAIVTPGGTKMTGEYDRHGFSYVIPQGEPDAGSRVDMVQYDDNTNQVTTTPGATTGQARTEIWNRCDLTT